MAKRYYALLILHCSIKIIIKFIQHGDNNIFHHVVSCMCFKLLQVALSYNFSANTSVVQHT